MTAAAVVVVDAVVGATGGVQAAVTPWVVGGLAVEAVPAAAVEDARRVVATPVAAPSAGAVVPAVLDVWGSAARERVATSL